MEYLIWCLLAVITSFCAGTAFRTGTKGWFATAMGLMILTAVWAITRHGVW
jgi:hypothetical protein